mgnify:CR=1 FL=1
MGFLQAGRSIGCPVRSVNSSILDHRVAEHYPDGIVIPHRGIARMLMAAVHHLEKKV